MSTPLVARLLRLRKDLHRVPSRAFHSPFAVLNGPSTLITSTARPVYEKQDDTSSEPHISSSGTRTYVVSEPDPSNAPYQVPSGAYPASTPYVMTPHKETGVGENAAVRGTMVPGETRPTHDGINAADASSGKI